MREMAQNDIAVLIPCLNEEAAIAGVVKEFKKELPKATIYVYDNGSIDNTAAVAKKAGASVRQEALRGKGNVMRRMFADVDAAIYVVVDGDGTYSAKDAKALIASLTEKRLDMVTGIRRAGGKKEAYRLGHRTGNKMLGWVVKAAFGREVKDIFSGLRVFSHRFVKSFPALSSGFEIETELTIHALELKLPTEEIDVTYKARPDGSESKLRTIRDGFKILNTIIMLYQEMRPIAFYGVLFIILSTLAWWLAYPIIMYYLESGKVHRIPTAILVMGLQLLGFISLGMGVIISTVSRGRRELKRMHYLNQADRDG
jgi:glycosyltransferase involved in cell wall biosynthesis